MEHIFASGLFEGQVALITGGGTGIGLATARLFVRLGGSVAIGSRKLEHLEPSAAELRKLAEAAPGSPKVFYDTLDIREPEVVDKFVERAHAELGRLDVLVNNAGGQFPTPAELLSPRGWDAVVRNNLSGTFYMTSAVARRAMIPQKRGRIVSITADVDRGFPGMVHTGAARAGVENLTKTLAIEWAQHNIQVTAIAPGVISSAPYPPELLALGRSRTPAKRLGTAEEVAQCVLYLASPAAGFITGTTVHIDGGGRLWGETWSIPDHGR